MGKFKDKAIDEANKFPIENKILICEWEECCLDRRKKGKTPCEWAVIGPDGKQDCGYG